MTVALGGVVLAWSGTVLAATGTAGYAITPLSQNVTLPGTAKSVRYYVTLANYTLSTQTFKLSTADFGSLNDTGGVAFIGTTTNFAKQHGLVSWMKLDETNVTIPAGGSTNIGVTIENSSSLSVGGHYGAILATTQAPPGAGQTGSRVAVREVLSSLLLVVKSGGPAPNLNVIKQWVNSAFWSVPSAVTDRFSNQGDVHVVPRGVITIKDPFGREIARGAMNVDSGVILPGMYRSYSTDLMPMQAAWMPGVYTIETSYRYDGSERVKSYLSSVWYMGALWFWLGLVGIVALGVAAWWLVRRRFHRA